MAIRVHSQKHQLAPDQLHFAHFQRPKVGEVLEKRFGLTPFRQVFVNIGEKSLAKTWLKIIIYKNIKKNLINNRKINL